MNLQEKRGGTNEGEVETHQTFGAAIDGKKANLRNGPITFSIVVPTRDRLSLLETSLSIFRLHSYSHFEIVVADNPTSEENSAKELCHSFTDLPIRYIRADNPLDMAENWNFALEACSGDFILFLTDKMFLLPGVLDIVAEAAIDVEDLEIVSWPFDVYSPEDFQRYLGRGQYFRTRRTWEDSEKADWNFFDPRGELHKRYTAPTSRNDQSSRDYAIGKIVFGAYSRGLVDHIVARHGKLFWEGSPDYTSMILALGTAVQAIELSFSGVLAVNTDFSNGELNAKSDERSLQGIKRRGKEGLEILRSMVVPGLYSSQHAVVSADYVRMARKLDERYELKVENWVFHCHSDLTRPDRSWSSDTAKKAQFRLLYRSARRLSFGVRFHLTMRRLNPYLQGGVGNEAITRILGLNRLIHSLVGRLWTKRLTPYSSVTSYSSLMVAVRKEFSR